MKRNELNPLLSPTSTIWESFAVFNPSVVRVGDKWIMLYRAIGPESTIEGEHLRLSSLGMAESDDGVSFKHRSLFLAPGNQFDLFGCEDPRVTFFEGRYYVFYTALSGHPFSADNIKVAMAVTADMRTVECRHLITPFNAKAMTLFPERINGKVTVILAVNTDRPPATVAIAQADSIEQLCNPHFWYHWYGGLATQALPLGRLNTDQIEVGATPVATPEGWLLVYSHIQNYSLDARHRIFGVEAALLDRQDPRRLIARTERPLLVPEASYEREGTVPNITFPTSAVLVNEELRVYYGGADTTVCMAGAPWSEVKQELKTNRREVPKALKLHYPVLAPRPHMNWERNGVFNPAIWDDGEKIHLLYRAQSDVWTSTLGYARFSNPYCIEQRDAEPAYWPRADFEKKKMKEGYSGCEDPRLTQIGDTIYMTYTAYDGVNPPRVALTSIPVRDLQTNNWGAWKEPRLISRPGLMDKNACLFPEKVGGKYVLLHRVDPDILIDTMDDLEFKHSSDAQFLDAHRKIASPRAGWDSAKIGAGAPPIKTPEGWLLLYHGVDKRDHQYRAGALMLDLNDPSRVLGRTEYPILEPELPWEVHGIVRNVVFPCGLTRRGEMLHIYYGGADYCVGVGTISYSELLNYLE